MDSSTREFLEQQLKDLETERGQWLQKSADELSRINTEIKKTKASLAPWVEEVPKADPWVAIRDALKNKDARMRKWEIVEKLKPDGYTSAQIGQSLTLGTRPNPKTGEIKFARSGKGEKIHPDELIGLAEWPKSKK
jgi:hypothetical protein